jgi:hypothetical protein
MLNSTILIKVKERLNKLDSSDYDNIQDWQIVEAFNKGQVDWCRRNLHGLNLVKEGDEQSTRRIDDLQVLLKTSPLPPVNKQTYYEVDKPTDYLQWKRISVKATSDCCEKPKPMVVYSAEEGNLDLLLRDKNKKPSYEWGETFSTQEGNKIKVYTNGDFDISEIKLTYYMQPIRIQIANVADIYTGTIPAVDTISMFKDDLVELFIDEAVKILAGDIEAINQVQRGSQSVEGNN